MQVNKQVLMFCNADAVGMNPTWLNSAQFYREKANSIENCAAQVISESQMEELSR